MKKMFDLSIKKEFKGFSIDIDLFCPYRRLGILGRSGSGKTQTLRAIAGLMDPDDGRLVVDNKVFFDKKSNINLEIDQRKTAMIFQSYGLFPNMTVFENVKFVADKSKQEIIEILDSLYLADKLKAYPKTLSGGEKQRLALARALAKEPELILLDEPFSALDQVLRKEVQNLVMDLIEKYDLSSVIVSHDPEEIYKMSDYVMVLDGGHLLEAGEKKDLFTKPNKAKTARLLAFDNVIESSELKDPLLDKFLGRDNLSLAFRGENLVLSSEEGGNYLVENMVEELSYYNYLLTNQNSGKRICLKSKEILVLGTYRNINWEKSQIAITDKL